MKYRRFGSTGLEISVFTFGAMRIPGVSDEDAVRTIVRGVELGINHLETARGYGSSEELLGKAMPHLDRQSVIITTKIGPMCTYDEMRRYVEESLQRMKIDHIENFDMHGINLSEHLAHCLKPGSSMAAIRKFQDEGVIGHVGFSTHGPLNVILEAINSREFESVNLHYYYFDQRNREAVKRAAELDMGVLIISPQDKGGMLFKPPAKLRESTAPYTPIQANARWLLGQPEVTTLTLGAAYPEEFEDQMVVADNDGPWSAEEAALFDRMDNQFVEMLGEDYCAQCYDCLPCPEGVHIPQALRLRNMSIAFDMVEFGKYRYKMFGNADHWFPGNQGNMCTECGDCLPRCPEKLDIPKLLFDVHERLSGEQGKRMWD